jgi:hypothetical protein
MKNLSINLQKSYSNLHRNSFFNLNYDYNCNFLSKINYFSFFIFHFSLTLKHHHFIAQQCVAAFKNF